MEGVRVTGGAGLGLVLVVLGALATLGCTSIQRASACPAQLQGMPMPRENGIQFGSNPNGPKPTACR
jgi:hypothetical protein